jgi:hypothetical protein
MESIAEELVATVEAAAARFRTLEEPITARRPAPGKWSAKDVAGHLIDSATNNHQRFVRAQLAGPRVFPGYEPDDWIACQEYSSRPWGDLVELWRQYNRHLAHLMRRLPAERREIECRIGDNPPVTLAWLMTDYVRHLRHHLEQIEKLTGPA